MRPQYVEQWRLHRQPSIIEPYQSVLNTIEQNLEPPEPNCPSGCVPIAWHNVHSHHHLHQPVRHLHLTNYVSCHVILRNHLRHSIYPNHVDKNLFPEPQALNPVERNPILRPVHQKESRLLRWRL